MRVRRRVMVLGMLVALGAAGWWWRAPLANWVLTRFPGMVPRGIVPPVPDPAKYRELKSQLDSDRRALAARHRAAPTPAARAVIEREARERLETMLPAMMRCWLGTLWDFNGTAETPGGGKIACGYFVATVLRDAGFRVERGKLARQASGNIIRSFVADSASTRIVDQPYETFTRAVLGRECGIYVVGLDTHVGFIVRSGDAFRFIHSSGRVVDESSAEAGVLQRSKWREFANLTGDRGVVAAWLAGRTIQVRGNE